jgi:hypothetical protein
MRTLRAAYKVKVGILLILMRIEDSRHFAVYCRLTLYTIIYFSKSQFANTELKEISTRHESYFPYSRRRILPSHMLP